MERGTSPFSNPEFMLETIKAALAARGAGGCTVSVKATVKEAVEAVIDADRAFFDYFTEHRQRAAEALQKQP